MVEIKTGQNGGCNAEMTLTAFLVTSKEATAMSYLDGFLLAVQGEHFCNILVLP